MTHITRRHSDAHRSRAGRRTSGPAAVVTILVALTCADCKVHGQDRADPRVRFEVASVRPNISSSEPAPGSGSGGPSIGVKGRRFTAVNAPLRDLIRYAYQLEPLPPIQGGSRLLDDRFEIAAVVPETVFIALEEQLGLRLERTRGPVSVLAIDRVEQLKAMD